MGIFSFLKSSGKQSVERRGNLLTVMNGRVQLVSTDTRKYVENGMRNAAVYSIVSFLAKKFATVPIYEYKVKDSVAMKEYVSLTSGYVTKEALQHAKLLKFKALEEANEDSEVSRLLKRPNSYQSRSAFFELLYMFKLLTGDAFMYANRGDWQEVNGKPATLHVLPSQFMNIVGDGTLWGIAYYYLQMFNTQKIPVENVMHWKYENPIYSTSGSHLYGLSPMKSAAISMDTSNAGKDALHSLFRNGGAQTLLTRRDQFEFTQEQVDALRDMLDTNVNGATNKGRVEATNANVEAISLGMSSADLQIMEGLDWSFKDLCNVFGVDYIIFDNASSTYNNKIIAQRNLITNKIAPEWTGLRDELNRWLMPQFYGVESGKRYLDYDIASLPEMQDDMEKTISMLKQMDWLTFNEKRKRSQEEPIMDNPNMNEILVPSGYELLRKLGEDVEINPSLNDEESAIS